ncbi:MAG TPA: hypothetical protein GXX55_08750 [Firmicutes bacterium]|nr:hypothetical protein [Bacillota bacterium]
MLTVAGRPRLLLMSSLFYFRLPRPLWGDRLRLLRQAGYTAVDVYIPWNYHELRPGSFDFSGERDIEAFFELCAAEGLAVVARPGPYICSEWDGGGLPAWLGTRAGMERVLRQNHPLWLAEVARWFDQVLPRIARYQDRGHGEGPVVAVQLENELDFFPCEDPSGYLAELARMARERGIVVPLLACAGQDKIEAAGGLAEGVWPTVNLYPHEDEPGIEERVDRVAARIHPRAVLVTETGRSHFLLRRLLAAGAKLLGPYLQTSGNNFGYWSGQNDWATPTCFQPTRYDFGGMIDYEGRPRWPEFGEAQLLGQLIRTFEPELLAASSTPYPVEVIASETTRPEVLVKARQLGPFIALIGLGSAPVNVRFAGGQGEYVSATAYPRRVRFLPVGLSLARFGLPVTVESANAELVSVEVAPTEPPPGENGYSRATLTFVGEPGETVEVRLSPLLRAPAADAAEDSRRGNTGRCVRLTVPSAPGETCSIAVELSDAEFPALTPEFGDPVLARTIELRTVSWPSPVDRRDEHDRALLPARIVRNAAVPLPDLKSEPAGPLQPLGPLEEAGINRGYGWYLMALRESATGASSRRESEETEGKLFFSGGSDVLSVYWNGKYRGTLCPRGRPFVIGLPRRQRGTLAIRVEIWGHSNFHHTREPALRLGSLRGLTAPWGWLVESIPLPVEEVSQGAGWSWRLKLPANVFCSGSRCSSSFQAAILVTGLTGPARLYWKSGESLQPEGKAVLSGDENGEGLPDPSGWIWAPGGVVAIDEVQLKRIRRGGYYCLELAEGARGRRGSGASCDLQARWLWLAAPDLAGYSLLPWEAAPEAWPGPLSAAGPVPSGQEIFPLRLSPGEVRELIVSFSGQGEEEGRWKYALELDGTDCKGIVYLNGHLVGRFWFGPSLPPDEQHASLPSSFYLPECWVSPGIPNYLRLLVEGLAPLSVPDCRLPGVSTPRWPMTTPSSPGRPASPCLSALRVMATRPSVG